MFAFLLWCILFVLCWPLALLALIAYPFIWLLLLPFRIIGVAVHGVLEVIFLGDYASIPPAGRAVQNLDGCHPERGFCFAKSKAKSQSKEPYSNDAFVLPGLSHSIPSDVAS